MFLYNRTDIVGFYFMMLLRVTMLFIKVYLKNNQYIVLSV